MIAVLWALIFFLVGCLVLVVIIYVAKLVLVQLELPDPVNKIALLIIGLIGLIALFILVIAVYNGGGPGVLWNEPPRHY